MSERALQTKVDPATNLETSNGRLMHPVIPDEKSMMSDERSMTSDDVSSEVSSDTYVTKNMDNRAESNGDNLSMVAVENAMKNSTESGMENTKYIVPRTKMYSHVKKTGDIAMERHVHERMEALGLLENKKSLEKQLAERLEKEMEKGDNIVNAINSSRRHREVRSRVVSVRNEINNIIRKKVYENDSGVKMYLVQLLMGRFTRDIRHYVDGQEVVICGSMPNGSSLHKETNVEFPTTVDMSRMQTSFKAGVFRMEVPFHSKRSVDSAMLQSSEEAAMHSKIASSMDNPFSESNSIDNSFNYSQNSAAVNGS